MKKLTSFIIVALCLLMAVPAQSQLRFGVRLGANVSDMSFNKDVFKSSNIGSFTGGLMAEFMLPVFNLGIDGAVMYTRKGAKFIATGDNAGNIGNALEADAIQSTKKLDYIEIPVNLKYKIGLPIIKPYIFAGPSFSFLVGNKLSVNRLVGDENIAKELDNALSNRKFDVAINLGAGLELFSKIQVQAQYGWGLNNAIKIKEENFKVTAKNRYWTITAAYLF
ncbi:porin family protein [Coprobacter tertius]|uniref:PorT family protein n=1 Tax=Coprobacter tertius TaxID=2944915 RepID=A0ABT1MDR1_9BACT|nr:porin family protein [Coprobacter tertius]MCP9610777.1 PorT family protein [Coprobacter tertius]